MRRELTVLWSILLLLFTGCSQVQQNFTPIADKSFDIQKGMTKEEVKKLLVINPTNKERINDEEIWKYEGNGFNEVTKVNKYNNVTIKFKDGIVTNIGVFSCVLPQVQKD
ncbi:MAG: hypothetical protein ACNI3C_10380 [Candidatus Marinarcus sp.]|uniref:hypothetical protein n=1 Tax=Candidatus Marinarcus sp. TaxID=3100987 RepID=UPI003B00795A